MEEKKNHLLAEENDNNSNNLQQKYLNQVKEDNAEILTIERSMNQLNDELKNYQILLEQTEQVFYILIMILLFCKVALNIKT